MNTTRKFLGITLAATAIVAVCYTESATAGTGGSVNISTKYGYAWSQMVNGTVSSKYKSSPNTTYPCAQVIASPTCLYSTNLPTGVSSTYYSRVLTTSLGVLAQSTYVAGGVTAGNPVVENLFSITPAPCAFYDLSENSTIEFDENDPNSGTVTVIATGTAGTGLLLRGYEYTGTLPETDPGFFDDFLLHNTLLWFVPLRGPFDTTGCPLKIPFTANDTNKVYFLADGAALSTEFTVKCPPDQVYGGSDTVVYPPLTETNGGCGNITVTYNPPASLLPCGTSTVTATATDADGNTATCTFNATRHLLFDGFYQPVGGTSPDDANCDTDVFYTVSSKKQSLPLKWKILCGDADYTGLGTVKVELYQCPGYALVPQGSGVASKDTSNVYHFNVDLTLITPGKYVIDVTLQDLSHKKLVIQVGK